MADRLWMFNPGCATEPCCETTGCGTIDVVVIDAPPATDLPGVTFTLEDAAGAVIATATTDFAGRAALDFPAAGVYHLVFEKATYPTVTLILDATCQDYSLVVYMGITATGAIRGCNPTFQSSPGTEIRVTIGSNVYLGFSSSGDNYSVGVGEFGTGTIQYSRERFQTRTDAITLSIAGANNQGSRTLTVATGYRCFLWSNTGSIPQNCWSPISETLYLSDPVQGPITLTYSATNDQWEGTKSGASVAGCLGGCPAATVTLRYELARSTSSSFAPLYIWYHMNGFNCPAVAGASLVPANAYQEAAIGCPPAFLAQLKMDGLSAQSSYGQGPAYCPAGGPYHFTITE